MYDAMLAPLFLEYLQLHSRLFVAQAEPCVYSGPCTGATESSECHRKRCWLQRAPSAFVGRRGYTCCKYSNRQREMMLNDCQSDKLTAATLEAALRVKEARKQCSLEETEDDCGSFQNGLDESDWLAELDEIGMLDVFEDVGLYCSNSLFVSRQQCN